MAAADRSAAAKADFYPNLDLRMMVGLDTLDLGKLLSKRAAVIATSLRARPAAEKAAIVAAVREHVCPLVESGAVRPIIHSRHPLEHAAEAHREMESSTHIGKILLTV